MYFYIYIYIGTRGQRDTRNLLYIYATRFYKRHLHTLKLLIQVLAVCIYVQHLLTY